MKLFIANCTKQEQVVFYRVAENPAPRQQHVPVGRQTAISGDLNHLQIDGIVTQLRKYGLVSVDDIDRTKSFAGLCYSVDKPVKIDVIMRALEHNDMVLTERGKEIRKEAAVALSNALSENVRGRSDLNSLEVEIKEQENNSSPLTEMETVLVTEKEEPGPRNGRGGRRKAA